MIFMGENGDVICFYGIFSYTPVFFVQGSLIQGKSPIKFFGFGLFVVFWTPLDTDLDTFGLFGRF